MPLLEPLPREELPQYEPIFQIVESSMGFVPSSMFTMARNPSLMDGFGGLSAAVMMAPETSAGLKHLVAHMVSTVAGCRYCQAHTAAHFLHDEGDRAKVEQIWEFETSELFTDAERAALRLARDAGSVPNLVDEANFSELRQHFTDDQILELVAVIALFGFLNRWNDTMATTLEAEPQAVASELLSDRGWTMGKHRGDDHGEETGAGS